MEHKGVGLRAAMVYLTEIGEASRFPNRRTVGSYWGMAPSSYESGEADDRKGHITRQGSPRVSHVLCQAAWGGFGRARRRRRSTPGS
jgi:transposase